VVRRHGRRRAPLRDHHDQLGLITSLPGASQLASALPASDQSRNLLVFDGLLTYCANAGTNGAYRAVMPTGTAGTGTGLTSDAAGGIVEITTAFRYFWDNYR
jgi:hypothetical protein